MHIFPFNHFGGKITLIILKFLLIIHISYCVSGDYIKDTNIDDSDTYSKIENFDIYKANEDITHTTQNNRDINLVILLNYKY